MNDQKPKPKRLIHKKGQLKKMHRKNVNSNQSMKQQDLTTLLTKNSEKTATKRRVRHGGGLAKGRRKEYRPISTKDSIHLVLRASKARGALSLLHKQNKQHVIHILRKQARKYFVQIRQMANVGNHLHLEVKISAKKEFQHFLRSVTCLIARRVTGAKKGKKFGKFWDCLAFTRIVKSYKEQQILERYIMANHAESVGGPMARARVFDYWFGSRWLLSG